MADTTKCISEIEVATRIKEVLIRKPDPKKWKTSPAGFRIHTFWQHPKTGATIALFICPKGVGVPVSHVHASNQFMYCLEGEYEYTKTNLVLKPGTFYMNPKGHAHGPTIARKDSVLLEMYDGPHYLKRPSYHSNESVGSLVKKSKRPESKSAKRGAGSAKKAGAAKRR